MEKLSEHMPGHVARALIAVGDLEQAVLVELSMGDVANTQQLGQALALPKAIVHGVLHNLMHKHLVGYLRGGFARSGSGYFITAAGLIAVREFNLATNAVGPKDKSNERAVGPKDQNNESADVPQDHSDAHA